MIITKIAVTINTGDEDPDKDTRIFLGFEGGVATNDTGREFRLRKGNDANPFRESTPVTMTFGNPTTITGVDVKNPTLNDPATPSHPLNDTPNPPGLSAYIRISPESKESWKIDSATVSLFGGIGGGIPRQVFSLLSPGITLQEDAGEKVYLSG